MHSHAGAWERVIEHFKNYRIRLCIPTQERGNELPARTSESGGYLGLCQRWARTVIVNARIGDGIPWGTCLRVYGTVY